MRYEDHSTDRLPDPETASPLSYAINDRDKDVIKMVTRAVESRNVRLAYQPIVPAKKMDCPAFFEGLIRILDDQGRIIPAREFITPVETLEVGRQIDCLALEMGLKTLREHPKLRLSINMSARSIGYRPWVSLLDRSLVAYPEIGERLILEVSEASTIVMPDIVQVFMADLQTRGVSFAIDTFGAGYSAIRYLKDMYFDILKIDGQFIRGIAHRPDNQVVTNALVSIGQHFDMVTVAEFVETAEDAQYLANMGVDCLQGYYFGAPTISPKWTEGAP